MYYILDYTHHLLNKICPQIFLCLKCQTSDAHKQQVPKKAVLRKDVVQRASESYGTGL